MTTADTLELSDYIAGLQCERRVWRAARLGRGLPELDADPALLELARARFPGWVSARGAGLEILERPAPAWADLVLDSALGRARIDLLERLPDQRYGIRQVKAIARVRPEHVDELAFALRVASAAGLEIASVQILHPDPEHVRGDAPSGPELLAVRELEKDARFLAEDVAAALERLQAVRGAREEPDVAPSPHCHRPHRCGFWEECTRGLGPDWVGRLPALRPADAHALREAGASVAREVPASLGLRPETRRGVEALVRARTVVASGLAERLAGFGPPADALDFEAIAPVLPRLPGTRPFEVVPFQWAAELARDANHEARGFLAEAGGDPRRAFAESLLEAFAGRTWPVLVYSGFEAEVLEALARALPDLAEPLGELRGRLRDLLPCVRAGVYAPEFGGSFSLKRVAPALVAHFDYAGLAIQDGGDAARSFEALLDGAVPRADAPRLRAELEAYCGRDARALIELLGALRALSA